MVTEAGLKKELLKEAGTAPEKFYPVSVLKEYGFKRKKCTRCGRMFWSTKERDVCGDPVCVGGYELINKPFKHKMGFIEVWKSFSSFMKKRGYTPIKRYPIVARWRSDQFWTGASIYDFQPYVVSGLVEPPANPLVVPQPCVRFNDIDNVGLSGRHNSCFVMIGQHAFTKPEDYKQDKYFRDLLEWLLSVGVPLDELVIHEDAWAGGGNMGASMEFFLRGLELCNQVYMKYKVTPAGREGLKLNVLDMGLGQNRISWVTSGTNTMYEAIYPSVMKKLFRISSVEVPDFYPKFLPYSGLLNADEIDMEKAWKMISEKINVPVNELKDAILPLAALFSVADHSRALLFAIADGAIPSNTGGGYDIRSLFRRAYNFIKDYDWNINLTDVCKWHAEYLKPVYPELIKAIPQVRKVLAHEEEKFLKTRHKWKSVIENLLKKGARPEDLVRAYDTYGISPQAVEKAGKEKGIKVSVPDDFYARVRKLHNVKQKKEIKKELVKTSDLPPVERLYYGKDLSFKARVLRLKGRYVVLNRTAFYPTSGGQEHDTGVIGGVRVVDVIQQEAQIIHVLKHAPGFKEGEEVRGEVDKERRMDTMRNHTATHIINGAARKVLGEHVWQAGSRVTPEKAHLDITHYALLTPEEIKRIEDEANKVVRKGVKVVKKVLPRTKAELLYGFRLYQGGDVPRKEIRVISIPSHDVEACGGTHVDNTSDIGLIKIIRTSKVQDGVIRMEFITGRYAREFVERDRELLGELEKITGLKAMHSVKELADTLQTQPEHLLKTVKRFVKESESFMKSLGVKEELFKGNCVKEGIEHLFKVWKKLKKKARRSAKK